MMIVEIDFFCDKKNFNCECFDLIENHNYYLCSILFMFQIGLIEYICHFEYEDNIL